MGCDDTQAASAESSIFPVARQEPPPRYPDLVRKGPFHSKLSTTADRRALRVIRSSSLPDLGRDGDLAIPCERVRGTGYPCRPHRGSNDPLRASGWAGCARPAVPAVLRSLICPGLALLPLMVLTLVLTSFSRSQVLSVAVQEGPQRPQYKPEESSPMTIGG
jgi:hypothetical protein